MIKFAAAYIRVSTDDQLEYSPDSQINLINDQAAKDGYTILKEHVYKDDGISGKSAEKRPGFRLMIAAAKEEPPPFERIYVWEYSRFARNQEESIVYKNLLRKNGVSVVSLKEPFGESPFAGLIERIIEWMDEFYLLNLSTEVTRGMTEKARRGEWMTKPPIGYKLENKHLVPSDEAGTIRYIFDAYANGGTFGQIALALRDESHLLKTIPASKRMVKRCLSNPVYIGHTVWKPSDGDPIDVPNTHPAIIPEETWQAVQNRLNANLREVKYVRKDSEPFMLKGLVRCPNCGATLVRLKSKYVSLQCCKYTNMSCTVSCSIRLHKMNAMVIAGLEEILTEDRFTFVPPKAELKPPEEDWDKLKKAVEQKLARAKAAYLDGAFTVDEYKQTKTELEAELSRISAKEEGDTVPDVDISAYHDTVRGVLDVVKDPDVDESVKNAALTRIIDKIVYRKKEKALDFYFIP